MGVYPAEQSYGVNSLNQPLMNPQLKRIPRLTPLTTGGLAHRVAQVLRRQAHRAFYAEVLGFCAVDELRADFFEGFGF